MNGIQCLQECIELRENDVFTIGFPVAGYHAFVIKRIPPNDHQMELEQEHNTPNDNVQLQMDHDLLLHESSAEISEDIVEPRYIPIPTAIAPNNIDAIVLAVMATRTGNYVVNTLRGSSRHTYARQNNDDSDNDDI